MTAVEGIGFPDVNEEPRPTPEDVDGRDHEELALWLLDELDRAPEIERGENFVSERLGEWFPGVRGVGAPRILGPGGMPSPEVGDAKRIEKRLRAAYEELMSRRLIERDPQAGRTFCKLTAEGDRVLKERRA